jgi:hypothetical protein
MTLEEMTLEEVLKSDLVRYHGIETALWIIANAHKNACTLLEIRRKRIEELERKLA